MNEIELKIAESIKTIERLLIPQAPTHAVKNSMLEAIDSIREALITAVGRRVIKEGLNG